jgi:hypothetical protein
MRLHRSGFLDKARKEAASAWKCQSLRSLGLRGLRALAPAMMLVGLLSRLRYLKAFGARGNFAAPNLERAQVFLKNAAMTVSPTGSSVQLRIAAVLTSSP